MILLIIRMNCFCINRKVCSFLWIFAKKNSLHFRNYLIVESQRSGEKKEKYFQSHCVYEVFIARQ